MNKEQCKSEEDTCVADMQTALQELDLIVSLLKEQDTLMLF